MTRPRVSVVPQTFAVLCHTCNRYVTLEAKSSFYRDEAIRVARNHRRFHRRSLPIPPEEKVVQPIKPGTNGIEPDGPPLTISEFVAKLPTVPATDGPRWTGD